MSIAIIVWSTFVHARTKII